MKSMAAKKDKRKTVKTKGDKDKGDKPTETARGPMFTEVERTFLELQLTEANRKIARLRATVEEHEVRNGELKKEYDTLDVDRADIISYLNKVLSNRNDEIKELKDQVKSLEDARLVDTAEHKNIIIEMEKNFKVMKEQLTSESKLLTSKLNTMEEFRFTRDNLMKKFEKQERQLQEQEMTYKRKIYDNEKKFVIGKDKLKKEMESRILQLAQEFQDNTGMRIAATTHRVIRENIAINNELDKVLASQAKVSAQNENYKKREEEARIAKELAEEERDLAVKKSVAQLKVIDKLNTIIQNVKKNTALITVHNDNIDNLKAKIQELSKENDNLILKVKILEQHLHGKTNDQNKYLVYASKVGKENTKLKNILNETLINIQAAIKLDEWATKDANREIMDRETLLLRLMKIVSQYHDTLRADSTETLVSFEKIYEKGDLGFVPKTKSQKSTLSITASIMTPPGSQEAFKCPSESSSMSDLGSIKTIPSMRIIPMSTVPQRTAKESFVSFATSSQSTTSESDKESEESDMNDIEKQLEQSKLEVQRAILKDLFSQRRPTKLFEIESVHEEEMNKDVVEEAIQDKTEEEGASEPEIVEGELLEDKETKEETVDDEEQKEE